MKILFVTSFTNNYTTSYFVCKEIFVIFFHFLFIKKKRAVFQLFSIINHQYLPNQMTKTSFTCALTR